MTRLLLATVVAALSVLLVTGLPPAPTSAQEDDQTCSDGLDNDNDGLIDLDDPSCVTLSEAPDATIAPTTEPVADPTATPVVTPSTVPDTGGSQGDASDGAGDTGEPAFNDWLTETLGLGAVVSLFLTFCAVFGVSLSGQTKRIIALGGAVGLSILYVATRDNLAIDSVSDVAPTIGFVAGFSQVAYLLIDGLLQGAANRVLGR